MRFLVDALADTGVDLHAFVLMSNHVHLLATAGAEGALSELMHRVGSKFARLMNMRWGRTGTLFEGRFRSHLVQDDAYLVTCMRYIDLNPVRAGLVGHPGDHPWSSYLRNAGHQPLLPLAPSPAYLALGAEPKSRAIRYRELCESALPEETLATIRESVQKSRPLGSTETGVRCDGVPDPNRSVGTGTPSHLTPTYFQPPPSAR